MKITVLRPPAAGAWWDATALSIERWLRRLASFGQLTSSYTSSATLPVDGGFVTADASGGAIVFALPSAASAAGAEVTVKKIDATGNTVTLDPDGTETIDGSTTIVINTQYDSITIKSDGVFWWIK